MCLLRFIGQNSSWMCSLLYWDLEICCLCICNHQQHPLCWLFQEEKRSCATVDICKALRHWTDSEEYCWKEPLKGIVSVCKFIVVDVSVFLGFGTALCAHLARDSWLRKMWFYCYLSMFLPWVQAWLLGTYISDASLS